jgi:hypothetical protein
VIRTERFTSVRDALRGHVISRTSAQYRGGADDGDEEEDGEQQTIQHDGRLFPFQLGQLLSVLFAQSLLVSVYAGVDFVQDSYYLVLEGVCNPTKISQHFYSLCTLS